MDENSEVTLFSRDVSKTQYHTKPKITGSLPHNPTTVYVKPVQKTVLNTIEEQGI